MDPADTIKNTSLKLIVLCCQVADPDPHFVGDPDSDLPYFEKPDPGPALKGQQREMVFCLNPSHIVQIE